MGVTSDQIAADNAAAASVPMGTVVQTTLFGPVALGPATGQQTLGWDLYEVTHSGTSHQWSSATIRATFTQED